MWLFNTQDAEFYLDCKNFLTDLIYGKLKDKGVEIADKDFIGLVLDMLRIVHEIV